jgi:hypothetical protein
MPAMKNASQAASRIRRAAWSAVAIVGQRNPHRDRGSAGDVAPHRAHEPATAGAPHRGHVSLSAPSSVPSE